MEFWLTALTSSLLLLCAVVLISWHVRTWRRLRRRALQPEDLDYFRRQYRRRMQSSAILGVLAVAIFLGYLLTEHTDSKVVFLGYWGSVFLLAGWMGLLALLDIAATRHHFSRIRATCLVEQAKLQAQIRRIRTARKNGEASTRHHEPGKGDRHVLP